MSRTRIVSVAVSSKGNVRKENQDQFVLNGVNPIDKGADEYECSLNSRDGLQIYGVFDGMGGESYGEEASYEAARLAVYYREYLKGKLINDINKYLQMYFKDANEKICQMIANKKVKASGTTAALVWLYKNTLYCGNIGDTRIYLFRDRKLQQLSQDHTEKMLLSKMGQYNRQYFNEHSLTQYLGISTEEMEIEPYLFSFRPRQKDLILICSDGLTTNLEEEEIQQLMTTADTIEEIKKRLLHKAMERGGEDNITIMLLQVYKHIF